MGRTNKWSKLAAPGRQFRTSGRHDAGRWNRWRRRSRPLSAFKVARWAIEQVAVAGSEKLRKLRPEGAAAISIPLVSGQSCRQIGGRSGAQSAGLGTPVGQRQQVAAQSGAGRQWARINLAPGGALRLLIERSGEESCGTRSGVSPASVRTATCFPDDTCRSDISADTGDNGEWPKWEMKYFEARGGLSSGIDEQPTDAGRRSFTRLLI